MVKKETFYKVLAFALTYIIYASIHANRTSWSSSKKKIEERGYISKESLGNIDTIFLLCYGFGNLLFGKKGDEMDLRIFLGIGLFFTILSNGFIAFFGFADVKKPYLFYICSAFNGLGQSAVNFTS